MIWSPQQDAALLAVKRWLDDPEQQVFRFFGYAGTGKTTLAKHFAEGVDGSVLYGAFTGKAAYVLRTKGCSNATTIHSMIYRTKDKGRAHLKEMEQELMELLNELRGEGLEQDSIDSQTEVVQLRLEIEQERRNLARPIFTLNPESAVRDARLVIIDECSMVDGQMGEDLLSFGVKVLVLGDPAQLPPVMGGGFFTEGIAPDVMLTEIHRQAKENPIIELATRTRLQESIKLGRYGDSLVVAQDEITPADAQGADQILVGRNATRHASNARMRQLLGRQGSLPVVGDRLVCLRNNHDKGLLNGAIWNVDGVADYDTDRIWMSVVSEEGGDPMEVEAHQHHFQGREDKLPFWERKEAEEFGFGYALTVHKAQGSQWNSVLLFDEAWCFRNDRWRWLYTGITRAAEKIKIVRM